MTIDELRTALEADGWRFDRSMHTDAPWYAWRKLKDAADCACNERPPSLILTPFEIKHNGETWQSVEFDVRGETGGRWLQLKAYSVPIDEALRAIPHCTELLRAAWNAAAAVKQED